MLRLDETRAGDQHPRRQKQRQIPHANEDDDVVEVLMRAPRMTRAKARAVAGISSSSDAPSYSLRKHSTNENENSVSRTKVTSSKSTMNDKYIDESSKENSSCVMPSGKRGAVSKGSKRSRKTPQVLQELINLTANSIQELKPEESIAIQVKTEPESTVLCVKIEELFDDDEPKVKTEPGLSVPCVTIEDVSEKHTHKVKIEPGLPVPCVTIEDVSEERTRQVKIEPGLPVPCVKREKDVPQVNTLAFSKLGLTTEFEPFMNELHMKHGQDKLEEINRVKRNINTSYNYQEILQEKVPTQKRSYVSVAEDEGEESLELPAEDDGSLLLSSLAAHFPGVLCLKYRNPESRAMRAVHLAGGKLQPPEEGWGDYVYYCVFSKESKQKADTISSAKLKGVETKLTCSNLIVYGLSRTTTERKLREYFESFGELFRVQVKNYNRSGQCKGFGFIRFASYESQTCVLGRTHLIDDHLCVVQIPIPSKVILGHGREKIQAEDLHKYFSNYGEVTDIFIPKPLRDITFVTFLDPEIAQMVCAGNHIIKGVSVFVLNSAKLYQSSGAPQRHESGRSYEPQRARTTSHGGYSRSWHTTALTTQAAACVRYGSNQETTGYNASLLQASWRAFINRNDIHQ